VTIDGFDVQRQRLRALRVISAVLEGNRNLYWRLTVRENLEYFAGNRGASRLQVRGQIDELLRQFRLSDKGNELVNHLSRGMQQKLAIAVAMLAGSEIILLDEPTLGLDVEAGYEVRQLLRDIAYNQGRTLIISSHDMPVVQDLCQRVVIISGGRVVADDQVSNLLKLFATRAYQVTLGAPLSGAQLSRLQARFTASVDNASGTMIRVNLEQGEDIYELIEILRLERTPVEAIDRTTINFEQVFLRVINGAKPAEETHAL
jgi:ABC-2 type transport system ATP-binding protein